MADNLGVIPNNGSPNYNSGLWPMPDSATASEADGSIDLSGIIRVRSGHNDGNTMSDSTPPVGGNDGDVDDSTVVG